MAAAFTRSVRGTWHQGAPTLYVAHGQICPAVAKGMPNPTHCGQPLRQSPRCFVGGQPSGRCRRGLNPPTGAMPPLAGMLAVSIAARASRTVFEAPHWRSRLPACYETPFSFMLRVSCIASLTAPAMMPAGMATRPTPEIAVSDAKNRPILVIGYTSP